MRTVLALVLILGMTPAIGELVELAVCCGVEGHRGSADAGQGGPGGQGCEHGCGTTDHCPCCGAQAVAPPRASGVGHALPCSRRAPSAPAALVTVHDPAPPYRPPIAS